MYEQNLTYARAIATAEHRIALGQTDVYIDSEWDFPFDKVTSVSSGGTYRLNIPSNIYLHFTEAGLSFRLSYELEERDANGAEQHRFGDARRAVPADGARHLAAAGGMADQTCFFYIQFSTHLNVVISKFGGMQLLYRCRCF